MVRRSGVPIFRINTVLESEYFTGDTAYIGLDKSGYQVNSFLISGQKYMLWVLIRSASVRGFK